MDKDVLYYLAFSHCLGIGPVRFASLLNHFKSPKEAYEAGSEELERAIGLSWARKLVDFRNHFSPEKKFKELVQKEIYVIPYNSALYPDQLKNIADPPICLYVKGDVMDFDFVKEYYLAVVGTRRPTSYGQQVAKKFSYDLSSAGFVIVSGMALGIDTIAHQQALEAGGKTIAVLGCGVDIVYPPSNVKLYQDIIKTGGIIISEFPPGHTVLPGLFIARNRIISGLSIGVLVVEGAEDSGALITARYAGEQGKQVFAPPGPITSMMSIAPNNLLKKGARLVTSVDDILEEFNLKLNPVKKEEIEHELNEEEKIIFHLLRNEPKLTDEIKNETKLSIEVVLNVLSVLEIKGVIEKNSEGKYQLSN